MGAADPELCRVSIIGGNTQLDMGLPANVPVAAFITDVVGLIESRITDLTAHDEGAPVRTEHWTLAQRRARPDSAEPNLTDAEVFDGELLVLRSVTAKESPGAVRRCHRRGLPAHRGVRLTDGRRVGAANGTAHRAHRVITAVAVLVAGKETGIRVVISACSARTGIAAGAAVIVAVAIPPARMTAVDVVAFTVALCAASAGLLAPGWVPACPHLLFSP